MKLEYVAKKSACSVLSFWRIILCVLIIPIIPLVFRIMAAKEYRLEFYADKIIVRSGFLNKKEETMVFMGVTGVSVSQSFWGQLFNYGTVKVDCVGKWDVEHTTYIKNPKELQTYLKGRIVKTNPVATPAYNQYVQM
jgi:uncharacterized membrane protein YdbT with pleckstrin-like domain